ncbi:MAG: CBS domain-containing protein [Bacteroidetes bacterium]|nr:CBS domain-containing protein [Bacteroidota bacterium]MBS1634062.1 CBS domain-containing protein [Bacteroidota bacterium]
MLTRELQTQSLPYLHLHDKVHLALQLMNDNHVTHLPVVEADKYIGIVSEEDLLQADNDHAPLSSLQQSFANISVQGEQHFLKAIRVATDNALSVLPVVEEENEITGVLVYSELLKYAAEFMSLGDPGGIIVLETESNQYSFHEISKLVETNDAQIVQLNTTTDPQTGIMQITIKVNKTEISALVATLQRYEYNVKYYSGEELYENELRTNYDNLMNYLKI